MSAQVAAQSLLDPTHKNPFEFDSSDPLVLFIVQAVIIILFCNVLALLLKRLRQPKVIAEVIGGILLGPTVMGRIPHFTNAIFPKQSIPFLSLVANIGLVLFLFIIGLEVDFKLLRKNFFSAAGIGLIGLIFPFGIGALVSLGIYNKFIDTSVVQFSNFLLFICVAFAITAFPVLCRILTELKLLQTNVGSATLAAGVANDVIGWVLLALAVTLSNSGAGLTALYVMLVVCGWVLFLVFIVKPVFITIARWSGSFETGPTPGIMCLVLLMTFSSAWFTQIIGVHAIFGGFLVGVIMPHEGGFANILASKIEDLVTVFFLPLYFTLSGLSTDLGLLKDGSIWGWTVCVIIAAEVSKFLPCFLAAMWSGMDWRESGAVGSLMACKGLVELIVLNIALNAGVLSPSVFAMFVLMAVVATFLTTPLTLAFYPESYRIAKARVMDRASDVDDGFDPTAPTDQWLKFLVAFSQLEQIPSAMAFVDLLRHSKSTSASSDPRKSMEEAMDPGRDMVDGVDDSSTPTQLPASQVSALRLLELSQRTSDVMKASEVSETAKHDPVLNIFHTFAHLNGVQVPASRMSIVPTEAFAGEITSLAAKLSSQLIVLPWHTNLDCGPHVDESNPIEKMLSGTIDSSPQYANLVRSVFQKAPCDVSVLVDSSSFGQQEDHPKPGMPPMPSSARLFCAFLGGPDDRVALSLVLQICRSSSVSAEIVRVIRSDEADSEEDDEANLDGMKNRSEAPEALLHQMTVQGGGSHQADTVYDQQTHANALASETADNLLWNQLVEVAKKSDQIKVETIKSATPFRAVMNRVKQSDGSGLMMFCGRSRQGGLSHRIELSEYLSERLGAAGAGPSGGHHHHKTEEGVDQLIQSVGVIASSAVRKSLGDLTSGLVVSGLKCKIMVVQSGQWNREQPPNITDPERFKA